MFYMKKKVKNKKKRIFLILSILIILLLSFSIGVYLFVESKELKVDIKKNLTVSINEEVYNTDYITNVKNGIIITKRKQIDTTNIGKQKITIKIKDYFNKIKKYSYKIEVVDDELPNIEFKDILTTEVGNKIDLLKDVKVTDNSNEDIKVEVEGNYDLNKPGTYELYYIAKDSSGNEKKEKFTLEVTKKVVVTPTTTNSETINFTTSKGFSGYTKNGITYIDGVLVVNKTYSIPSTYYTGDITSETRSHMNQMFADAKAVGLNIYLSSGFRSYNTQKNLYNNYVAMDGKANADTYSARPGHSEHQTGLAFDVNQVNNTFDDTPEANWLSNNCYKYGFILRYPKGKTNETGYMYESWHFRYVGVDLASKLYNNGDWITLENYFGITSQYNY